METILNKLNFFKSKKDQKQEMNILIQEIHDSFNKEGELLLKEAKEILSKISITKEDKNLAERLAQAGFHASPIIKEKEKKEKELKINNELAILIDHYNFYYPQNKFITADSVYKLCSKYNLIQGKVSQYIGSVPLGNLKHIENFKVRDEDKFYFKIFSYSDREEQVPYEQILKEKLDEEYKEEKAKEDYLKFSSSVSDERQYRSWLFSSSYKSLTRVKNTLEICAPRKDFILGDRQKIENKKIVDIPDPVVLYPVNGGYLIVTAWGIEAEDNLVKNSKHN